MRQTIRGTFAFPVSLFIELQQLNNSPLILLCDTSTAPVIINLPEISALGGRQFGEIIVVDSAHNASVHNITINLGGANTFNGVAAPEIITADGGILNLQVVNDAEWQSQNPNLIPGSQKVGMFYGLTAGTGNGGPTDYAATIAVKTGAGTGRVPFPRDGATTGIIRNDANSFVLPATAKYEVTFRVHSTEPGQLQLELNGADLPETCSPNMNPTAGGHPIVGSSIISAIAGQILAVVNPVGNSTALTITPANGADTHANAQTITIKQIVG